MQTNSNTIIVYEPGAVSVYYNLVAFSFTANKVFQNTNLIIEILRVSSMIIESCVTKNLNYYNSLEVYARDASLTVFKAPRCHARK
jgi:hypothetical protein